jgi:hypothetical protein
MTCTIVLGFTSVCSIPVVSRIVFVRIANYTSTSPGSSQSFFSTVDRLIDRLWLSQLVKRSLRVSVNHSDWSVNPQWLNNG